MKNLRITAMFIVISSGLFGQQILSLEALEPKDAYENIHVKALDDDQLTSTYMIWVKESVRTHYHAEHTEVVYVVEGNGTMTLGKESQDINPGDYVFIPKGTHHSVEVKSEIPMKVLSVQTPHFDGSDRIFVDQ